MKKSLLLVISLAVIGSQIVLSSPVLDRNEETLNKTHLLTDENSKPEQESLQDPNPEGNEIASQDDDELLVPASSIVFKPLFRYRKTTANRRHYRPSSYYPRRTYYSPSRSYDYYPSHYNSRYRRNYAPRSTYPYDDYYYEYPQQYGRFRREDAFPVIA